MNIISFTKKNINNIFSYIMMKGVLFNVLFCAGFLVSFRNDIAFFDFSYFDSGSYYNVSGTPYSVIFYIILKTIWSVLLYICTSYAISFLQKTRIDKEARKKLVFVMVILFVYFIFIILCYPGMWWNNGGDEFRIFMFAKHLQVQYHQGFLSSVFFIWALMLWPKPVMPIVLQAVIGAIILGSIGYELGKKRKKYGILMMLVALCPASLYFMLYAYRMYITSVFLIGLTYMVYTSISVKNLYKQKMIILGILLGVVANFRIEMFPLIIVMPFILILFMHESKEICNKVLGVFLIAIMCTILFSLGNKIGNQHCSVTHNLLSFTAPLGDIIEDPNAVTADEWNLLDKFFYMDQMLEDHAEKNYYYKFEYERLKKPELEYDKEELKEVEKIIIKLFLKHPDIYLKNKLRLAYDSSGLNDVLKINYQFPQEVNPTETRSYLYEINPNVAYHVKRLIAGDYYIGKIKLSQIWFPFWLPFEINIFLAFISFIRKKYDVLFIQLIPMMLSFIVFLTSIYFWGNYNYPEFVLGWLSIFIAFREIDEIE